MIKFILPEEVLPLRSLVLRDGKPLSQCVFPTDEEEGALHIGFFDEDKIVSVVSLFPNDELKYEGYGYQLRGMATHPSFVGKGCGSALVAFAADFIKALEADYIWCNARLTAAKFYEKLGFTVESDQFDIAGIGPHYVMKLNLNM